VKDITFREVGLKTTNEKVGGKDYAAIQIDNPVFK
jgi:hypothetical protein